MTGNLCHAQKRLLDLLQAGVHLADALQWSDGAFRLTAEQVSAVVQVWVATQSLPAMNFHPYSETIH